MVKSSGSKFRLCLIVGLTSGASFLRIGRFIGTLFVPLPLVLVLAFSILIGSIAFGIFWPILEKRGKLDSTNTTAWWVAIMRYSIAFDLIMFGFEKFAHYQFNTPLGMLDEPFSSFSGEWLTWSYFGHSYPFICTIATLQIAGSLLLVFNRTRLLGTVVIIPVLFNIVLIDLFYGLAPGVLVHAILMLIATVYLLLLDYDKLSLLFLKHSRADHAAPVSNSTLKNVLRFSVLALPMVLLGIKGLPDKNPELTGKYAVVDMKLNGLSRKATTCQDSLLTIVYFDLGNDCVFEFNGIRRRLYGQYDFNKVDHKLSVSWHFPPTARDKFDGTLKFVDGSPELSGAIGKDNISVSLKKLH